PLFSVSALYDSLNAALLDSFDVTEQTFSWKGETYGCSLSAESARLVTAKSLFANGEYPEVGDIIRVGDKDQQVRSVANATLEFAAGGLVAPSGAPFVDDPSNPSLAISF